MRKGAKSDRAPAPHAIRVVHNFLPYDLAKRGRRGHTAAVDLIDNALAGGCFLAGVWMAAKLVGSGLFVSRAATVRYREARLHFLETLIGKTSRTLMRAKQIQHPPR
jgi:hypothetical protein